MSSRTLRRAVAPCLLAGAMVLAACGDPAPDRAVRTGSGGQAPVASSTTTIGAASPDAAVPSATTAVPAGPAPTTTALGIAGDPSPSAVAGLTPDEVKAAALVPATPAARRAPGATVETFALASGTRVWRVRIPGDFAARSARVAVTVGERVLGPGIVAPSLDALLAVTTDGTGLTAGAAVGYRWEGGDPVPAGKLGVAR